MCPRLWLWFSTYSSASDRVISVEKPFRFTLSMLDKLSFHILNNLLRFSVIPDSFQTALDSTLLLSLPHCLLYALIAFLIKI